MDETAVIVEAKYNSTVHPACKNIISVRCSGSSTRVLTAIVSVRGDGTGLQLLVIFKGEPYGHIENH